MTEEIQNQPAQSEPEDKFYEDFDSECLPFKEKSDEKEVFTEEELKEAGEIDQETRYTTPMNNTKGYVTPVQAKIMMDYFKDKAIKSRYEFYNFKRVRGQTNQYDQFMKSALLLFTLWYSGRRISEIVGNPPYDRVPGLRPCDINYKDKLVTYSILKKNSVMKKNKSGSLRSEEAIKKDLIHKSIVLEEKPMPEHWFKVMKYWIDYFKIGKYERIFQTSRNWAYEVIREAARECNLSLPGYKYFRVNGSATEYIKKPANITPHAFRHGYAMNFLEANKTNPKALPILSKLLSHEDINTTKEYLNFGILDMKPLVDNIDYSKNKDIIKEKEYE